MTRELANEQAARLGAHGIPAGVFDTNVGYKADWLIALVERGVPAYRRTVLRSVADVDARIALVKRVAA